MLTITHPKESKRPLTGLQPMPRRALRQADILLTHAYVHSLARYRKRAADLRPPLGPLYVASALRDNGYHIDFFDTTFTAGVRDFRNYIGAARPGMVGIFALETTRRNAFAMIRACRMSGIDVVAGGPDPSADPEAYISAGASYVVQGEGEEAARRLLARHKENGGIIRGGAWESEARICRHHHAIAPGMWSYPARDLVDFKPYFTLARERDQAAVMDISVARGCPYRCSWCSESVFGGSFRQRPARDVAEEFLFVKMLYRPDLIVCLGQVFGYDTAWLEEFRREMLGRRAVVPFEGMSRPELVTAETARLLREAGCSRLWFEIGSGSPAMLERMGNGVTLDSIDRSLRLAHEAGIEVGWHLMLGYPSETVADVDLTRKLIASMRPDRCKVEIAYPVKGTAFYRDVESRLLPLRADPPDEDENLLTFGSPYPQYFYDQARRLLLDEVARHSRGPGLAQAVRYRLSRLGYGIAKWGLS